MFGLVEHPRDGTGRFIVSGSRRDPKLARLEQRLAAAELLVRSRWRAQAPHAGPAGMTLPPLAEAVSGGD